MTSVNMPNAWTHLPTALQPLQDTINHFLTSAKKVADKALQPASVSNHTTQSKVRHYHHHHYHGCYSPWWFARPTYVIHTDRRRRDEDDQGARVAVGLISVIVGAVAFYTVGRSLKSLDKTQRKLQENTKFAVKLKQVDCTDSQTVSVTNKLERIAALQEKILKQKRSKAFFNLAATITLAAACVFATIGAIYAVPALMCTGAVLGLGVGAIALVKWGMSSDSKQKSDAKDLLANINALS